LHQRGKIGAQVLLIKKEHMMDDAIFKAHYLLLVLLLWLPL
jgi:hypothetical protein